MLSLTKPQQSALQYLVRGQQADGSWSGPYSSRIRETYLAYVLGQQSNWPETTTAAAEWLDKNASDVGDGAEQLLNQQFINLYRGLDLDLTAPELYSDTIMRKTLQILALAIVGELPFSLPAKFADLNTIAQLIRGYLLKHQNEIKTWAAAEFLANLIILETKLGRPVASACTDLLELQDQSDNWYHNPNTTMFSLIALNYAGQSLDLDLYKKYIDRIQQPDKGWTFCPIPVWDTGLALISINLSQKYALPAALRTSLDLAYQKALAYISDSQNVDGGWGFIPGLESESDTSAIVLTALAGSDHPSIANAHKYYQQLQFETGEYAGLWPVWRHTEVPSLEVVAHIVTALQATHSNIDLTLAQAWMASKIKADTVQADWGRSQAYSIYSVLNTGQDITPQHPLISHLLQAQNPDGGWGMHATDKSNASATANAILALKLIVKPNPKLQKAIENGVTYMVSTQTKTGTWPRVKEVVGSRPYTYADDSSTHNFALHALLT